MCGASAVSKSSTYDLTCPSLLLRSLKSVNTVAYPSKEFRKEKEKVGPKKKKDSGCFDVLSLCLLKKQKGVEGSVML